MLTSFKNRQVVINVYENEELVKKDGFFFDTISCTANEIIFIKNNLIKATIDLSSFKTFTKDNTFKDCFILKSETSMIEIYFP